MRSEWIAGLPLFCTSQEGLETFSLSSLVNTVKWIASKMDKMLSNVHRFGMLGCNIHFTTFWKLEIDLET